MAYIDVISLADAKAYLRVDFSDDDAQITRMIKSALSTIEKMTNVLVYARNKSYLFQNYCTRVYDYPINSVVSTFDYTATEKELYTIYEVSNADNTKIELNVGYSDPADVPSEIIDCALQYIKYMYYEAETDKANRGELPKWLKDIINQNKRFII